MHYRTMMGLALTCAVLVALPACSKLKKGGNPEESAQPGTPSDAQAASAMPSPGDQFFGFRVERVGRIDPLGADAVSMKHMKSGADLIYIRNDDRNLGFSIMYRTPYLDETDTNHVFEHAVIASSAKYPGKDIFFDLYSKTYNTFLNAFTYSKFTGYPVSSQSQSQLEKMADVYLSCMVSPELLENENIFKREAIRYELENKDAQITMAGTVFSEDNGSLTDIQSEAYNNMLDALYSDGVASNSIGRAHRNYKDLTYENTLETFERCYHFDNSLIVLYGDMDYERMLDYLDREYLSKAENSHTNLSQYTNQSVEPGYVEKTVKSPAYAGDQTEHASLIEYGIDLSGYSWETLFQLDMLTAMMENDDSPFHRNLRSAGINNQAACFVDLAAPKPILEFQLEDADAGQKEAFKQAVQKSLEEVAQNGFFQDIFDTVVKTKEINDYLAREGTNISVDVSADIAQYWAATGKTDYYDIYESAFEALRKDAAQSTIRKLAGGLLKPARSALVTTVPTPGLAEQIEQERKDYLSDMKAAMTEEEQDALVRETEEFSLWNQTVGSNSDFIIDVADLPDPVPVPEYRKERLGDITSYTSAVSLDKISYNQICFDTSGIPAEDLYYLPLYELLLTELDTDSHTSDELKNLAHRYLYRLSMQEIYPGIESREDHRPMLSVRWYCLSEDYEESLELLTELMGETRFGDGQKIARTIERYQADYDLSRSESPLSLARDLADEAVEPEARYVNYMSGQGFYRFLKETGEKLKAEPAYADQLNAKLQAVAEAVLHKDNLRVMSVAHEGALTTMKDAADRVLNRLPKTGEGGQIYADLPFLPARTGVIVETPDQSHVRVGDMNLNRAFKGRYLPFLQALSDKYVIPRMRFAGGAYSASAAFSIPAHAIQLFSVNDPRVGESLDIFDGAADFMSAMELNQREFDGYILSVYGSATRPAGELTWAMTGINREIQGVDSDQVTRMIKDIKEARLTDQAAASQAFRDVMSQGRTVTVGNERVMEENQDRFDQLFNYKH